MTLLAYQTPCRYPVYGFGNISFRWTLQESTGPYANLATGGTLNMTEVGTFENYQLPNIGYASSFYPIQYVPRFTTDASSGLTTGATTLGQWVSTGSIHCWLYWETHQANATIFGKVGDTGVPNFAFGMTFGSTANAGGLVARYNLGAGELTITSTTPIPRYKWTHVAMSYSASELNDPIRLYIDGVQTGFGTTTGADVSWGGSSGPWIAGTSYDTAAGFTGRMTELIVQESSPVGGVVLSSMVQYGRTYLVPH